MFICENVRCVCDCVDQLNSHLSSKQDETECVLCVLLVFLSRPLFLPLSDL